LDSERHRTCLKHISSSIMNARKIELLYHPVFKGSKEPTQEEVQRKVTTYLTHHPEFKPQKEETWSCFKTSPGFTHASVECYLIVSLKLLKEPEGSEDTIRYSNIVLYDFLKKGILLI